MSELMPLLQTELNHSMAARRTRANATNRNMNAFEVRARQKLNKVQKHIKTKYAELFGESAILTHEILISKGRLKALAERLAVDGYKVMQSINESHFDNYEDAIRYVVGELSNRAVEVLITPPLDFDNKTTAAEFETAILKLVDVNWYMRRFIKMSMQYKEYCQLALGRVGGESNQHKYISKGTFHAWKTNQKKMQEYIKTMALYDEETGDLIDLEKAIASSTANPENRRVEMMVRARGFEELAVERDYCGLFITWTLPSRFHRNSAKWDGSTVFEGQAELMNQWARARARVAKDKIDYFGFRVAEPHKDSTPHAHYFLFVSNEDKDKLLNHLRNVARGVDAFEMTCEVKKKARFKAIEADPKRGGATAYIAKYISKNINGAYLTEEPVINTETGKIEMKPIEVTEAMENAFSVRAWASLYNIRQFQQFGGACVSLWRQARRLTPEQVSGDARLTELRECVQGSKWSTFCNIARGVALAYEENKNQYQETIKKVIGFEWLFNVIRTARESGLVLMPTRKAEALKEARSDSPWSTWNKCNLPEKIQSALTNLTGFDSETVEELAGDMLAKKKIFKMDTGQVLKIRNNQLIVNG